MLFSVTKNKVVLSEEEKVNEGEYKATLCQFEFDDVYTGLVIKAVFTNSSRGSYEVPIINDRCDIPAEVLQSKGSIKVGVYGYEVNGDELVLRYSPSPTFVKVDSGSYVSNPMNPEEITPTQFEQYMQAMNDGLAEVENVNIDATKEGDTATITITNRDGETKSVEIKDGSGGGGGGTSDYNQLTNKPSINGVTLQGNLTASALGINEYDDTQIKQDISTLQTGLSTETTNRENADLNLQSQIDAITVSSDVIDILGTYAELQAYDTSHVKANDIIKVIQDETHNDAMSYYRWEITNNVGAWVYVGSEGPFYTKSETDTLLGTLATQSDLANVTSYITNATDYSASATYAVGDYVIHDGTIYQCNTTIVGGEAWTAAHWDTVDSLQEQLDNTETWTFTLSDNTTVTKKVVVR